MNSNQSAARTNYRWVVCGLLLFSTTVNYMDRQVISYLKGFFCTPIDHGGFGWSNSDFSNVTSAFTAFYAGMTIIAGWFIDKIGTKLGLAISLIIWSIFGIVNAFAGGAVLVHIMIRSAFGIGEGGNFPASIKTVAEWFPKRERALATGIFNSGTNLGAMICALFVPWCLIHFGDQRGWRIAFVLTGSIGFLWLIFWFWLYDTPARQTRVSKAELDYINSDAEESQASGQVTGKDSGGYSGGILRLLEYRQTWSFFVGKFFTDGIWWFYLFWLPDYLFKQFGMDKHHIMLWTFFVYGVSIVGSIWGGGIPLALIKRGMDVYRARMTAMFIIAIFPLAVLTTQYFGDVSHFGSMAAILAVSTISIGAAAHQAWSANLFTTVSDMFPRRAVGSVTGIGAMAGGLGGVLIQKLAGWLTDAFKEHPQTAYYVMFIVCALVYLIAWSCMKTLVPRHKPITDL